MKFFAAAVVLLFSVIYSSAQTVPTSKVICYYDSRSFARDGQGKMQITDLDPALSFCTHLVYGYAIVNKDTNKLAPLNEQFDVTKQNYQSVTELKRRFPGLRILLSVGGGADDQDDTKYMTLLEAAESRIAFVNSAHTLLKAYNFDGLDLAWEFPTNKPKKVRSTLGSLWHGFKKKIGVSKGKVDDKEEEHREQFTALVRELKNVFRHDGLLLSLSVIPNVNSTIYYDTRALMQHLDWVNLMGFDYQTPKRNPKEVDYPAPLYELIDRHPDNNLDHSVRRWLETGAAPTKLIVGIPTFARCWKMTTDSAISGVPPFETDGACDEGPYTKNSGLLSYAEVCAKMNTPVSAKGADKRLRKVGDPSKRYGTYAFRLPDENNEFGMWVGYEDPDTAGNKASYAKAKGLGGISINDLSLDDFRGLCTGDKYPVLRAAKFRL